MGSTAEEPQGQDRAHPGPARTRATTKLPAFVVPDIPAGLVAAVGVYVLVTIVRIVWMLKPARTTGAWPASWPAFRARASW